MPTDCSRRLRSSKKPRTPTTASSFSSASVVAGFVQVDAPAAQIVAQPMRAVR